MPGDDRPSRPVPRADPSTPTFPRRSFSLRPRHLRQLTNHSLPNCPPPPSLSVHDRQPTARIDSPAGGKHNSVHHHHHHHHPPQPINQTRADTSARRPRHAGEMPTPSPPTATLTRPPGWFESFRKRSAHERSGHLGGLLFALGQVIFRTVALLFEIATLAFVAWTFAKWQDEATVRVDIVWPCFFPVSFSFGVFRPGSGFWTRRRRDASHRMILA